jgi:50S ribosomal protein L16 3-hydroxylase
MNKHLLGGLAASAFMREYWQKKPLLVRGAFPAFAPPLSKPEVLELARREEAESRLVKRAGGKWTLDHGPFSNAALKRLPPRDWTILVQDVQHFSPTAKALLQAFNFIPHARVDDVMVSLAAPGGGVGPHFDSYDVFLLQGPGRRHWRISAQHDLALKPGMPLKILKRFKPEREWVLEQGDMLYLPPGYAHDGVALDECLTFSIGFRAPAYDELQAGFLDHVRDSLAPEGQYRDPDLKASTRPGAIPAPMLRELKRVLRDIRWSDAGMDAFLGRFLTEPKSHVFFDPPASPLSSAKFASACQRMGAELDARTRCLYAGNTLFINGEAHALEGADGQWLRALADRQKIAPGDAIGIGKETVSLLHGWYRAGFLHLNQTLSG